MGGPYHGVKNEVKLIARPAVDRLDTKIELKQLVITVRHQMLMVAIRRRLSMKSYTMRVQITAVKTEVTKPMQSVTAKPLTGPVPNWKRN